MKSSLRSISILLALSMLLAVLPAGLLGFAAELVEDARLESALDEAQSYIDGITINNSSNDPSKVVSQFGTHFTWDNEKRENSKSYLFDWSYYNGVVFEGIEYLYNVTGDEEYKDYLIEYMEALIASDGTWAKCTNNSSKQAAGYNASHGADCYKTASLLVDTYKLTGDARYLTMAATLYADLTAAEGSYSLSNAGGNYRHTWSSDPSPDLWLDGLYMILPFRAEYAAHTGDVAELNQIVSRLQWVSDNMYDESTGLFYHAADSATSNSETYWLRSIGWYAAALVDVMDHMEGSNLTAMQAQLKKLVDGMKAKQNASNGMWLNNMAASQSSSNPYETSGTALVAYAVMKAVNSGWLDESYADMAIDAFVGICENKLSGSTLTDICFKGAPGSSNSTFYDNEGKGVGPFIMLYAEVLDYSDSEELPVIVGDDKTGVYVAAPGVTDITVTEIKNVKVPAEYTAYVSYDINLEGYTQGDTATVTIPVDVDRFDINKPVQVIDEKLNKVYNTYIVDGEVTFTTTHFSVYSVAQLAETDDDIKPVTGNGYLLGNTQYVLDTDTDGIDAGATYLIVSANSGNNAYAFRNNNGASARQSVSISNGVIASGFTDESTCTWTFTASGDYWDIINGTQKISLSTSDLLRDTSGNAEVSVTRQNNGAYRIDEKSTGVMGYTQYYLSFRNNAWTRRTSTTNSNVYLFKQVTTPGAEVTFTVAPGGATLQPGSDVSLKGTVTVGGETVNLSDCTITWASSDPGVATVSNAGVVTGVADGDINITATLTAVEGTALESPVSLEIPVTVSTKTVVSTELVGNMGMVYVGSGMGASTGTTIKITYKDGSTKLVLVTLNMLTTADGAEISTEEVKEYKNVKVSYNGQTWEGFTLNVVKKPDMNFPEYPDPGSVKLNKVVADTKQFQNTGVAEIQLSTSGIPIKRGVDVVLVADISNSMAWEAGTTGTTDATKIASKAEDTKWYDLTQAASTFANILLANHEDGSKTENTISFVTFGGYDAQRNNNASAYSGYADATQTHFVGVNDADTVSDTVGDIEIIGTQSGSNVNYTISGMATGNGAAQGGTNYDHAFLETAAAIESLKAKYAADNNGMAYEDSKREIYVVFMTDGAPDHYNQLYYKTRSNTQFDYYALYKNSTDKIDNYVINKANDLPDYAQSFAQPQTNGYYLGAVNNERWIAWLESDSLYAAEYVRGMQGVNSITSIGFDLANGAFGGYTFSEEILSGVLSNLAGENSCDVFLTDDAAALNEFYASLASQIKQAATGAYFVDQMGSSFKLQTQSYITKYKNGAKQYSVALSPFPAITISNYKIYTKADLGKVINGKTVTEDMIGLRYGDPTVLETVVFSADGTKAFSSLDNPTETTINPKDADGNLLKDINGNVLTVKEYNGTNILGENGVIEGHYFWYNTGAAAVRIDTNGDGDEDYELPAETFYWKIGTIRDSEFVLSYHIYLEGAAEGEAHEGSYKTNNYATLYYKNWLDNDVSQDIQTPSVAWESAQVSYGFYLVDKTGKPVTNRATGATGAFGDAVKVTSKIHYKTILLNTISDLTTISVNSLDKLPADYKIFDQGAIYEIIIDSNASVSGWEITVGKDANGNTLPYTTYVTDYGVPGEASNELKGTNDTYDYTSTTVWFAVLWEPQAMPDAIVIDYGLPVDISVLENDMFGSAGHLTAIGAYNENLPFGTQYASTPNTSLGKEFTGKFGTLKILDNGEVRYTPNTMSMSSTEVFVYEARYQNSDGVMEYYYGVVTIIPATIIYYEESFVSFKDATDATDSFGKWKDVTDEKYDADKDITQAEDRPGFFSLSTMDANNVYGYDAAYNGFTKYSLGGAKKVTVDADTGSAAKAPEVTFTFTGTGFDIISLTDADSGTILVTVQNVDTNVVKRKSVNNYYGYQYNETTNEWEVKENADGCIWQVPVIKFADLDYGTYTVKIQLAYMDIYDHADDGSYSFWMDAVRVYSPADAEQNDIIKDAYTADKEYAPQFKTLRNLLIEDLAGQDKLPGIVFIDGKEATDNVQDYKNPGPNNETYLAYGQGIAFRLVANQKPSSVHLGVKLAFGSNATLMYNMSNFVTVDTATDRYFDLNAKLKWTAYDGDGNKVDSPDEDETYTWQTDTIYLSNTTDGAVISLTNLKCVGAIAVLDSEYGVSTDSMGGSDNAAASSVAVESSLGDVAAQADTNEFTLDVVVDEKVIEDAIATMTRLYKTSSSVFVPQSVTAHWQAGAWKGNSVLSVTTSDDVQYITVDGKMITTYTRMPVFEMNGENRGIQWKRVWIFAVEQTKCGSYDYQVVMYNADNVGSDALTVTLVVDKFMPSTFDWEWKAGKPGQKSTLTVTTSDDVDSVKVGNTVLTKYVRKYTKVTVNGVTTKVWYREWTYSAKLTREGRYDFDLTVFDENGNASNTVLAPVSVRNKK